MSLGAPVATTGETSADFMKQKFPFIAENGDSCERQPFLYDVSWEQLSCRLHAGVS